MNSMSKYYYRDDDCEPCNKGHFEPCNKGHFDPCDKKKEKFCPTIIKCSSPGSVTIPAATVAGTTFTLTSLTLNTRELEDPCIKLEFASNLVATVAFTGTINFQIFRQCNNQITPTPIGPIYTFSLVALLASQTFSFFVCDCNSCFNECCTYTVVATVTSAVTVGTLSINNATLGAIATCGSCC